jgi:hypothetical protein
MNTLVLRDPTAESVSVLRKRRAPPQSLQGLTIGLMDIGKMRGDEFIDRLEQLLVARGQQVRRYRKPTNTRTAPVAMLQAIAAECDLVVIALSDCGSCTSCSTHDLNDLDQRGVPGASVLTTEFRDAFAKQCRAIGFEGASVYVPHPMQNRTTAELHALADDCFAEILARIVADGAQS